MTKHIFYYNGKSTADFGIYISGEDTWKKPAPDLERTEIPGRNGDLVSTNRRYKNIDIEYHAGIIRDFDTNYSGFTNFLLSSPGYHRLEDSYHPEVYRMGVMESSFEPEMAVANKAGKFNVRFSCKPQMFLKAGEQERTFFFLRNTGQSDAFRSETAHPGMGNGKAGDWLGVSHYHKSG